MFLAKFFAICGSGIAKVLTEACEDLKRDLKRYLKLKLKERKESWATDFRKDSEKTDICLLRLGKCLFTDSKIKLKKYGNSIPLERVQEST